MDDYRRLRKEVVFDASVDFPRLLARIHAINALVNGIEWPLKTNYMQLFARKPY